MNMVSRKAVTLAIKYLSEDPMNKLPKLFSLAEALDRGHQRTADIRRIRGFLEDENNNWHIYAKKLSEEVDPRCLRKVMECFFVNSMLDGIPRGREIEQKYDINVPWVILLDPTSACNLSCVGCWAAEYGHKFNLSYETLDSIVRQGNELGIHFYIFSGGEPLVRKKDIIRLCRAHQDCYFFAFTNGTLVDDELCLEMKKVGNFSLAFSIEGDREATDFRRGEGTYQKVIDAMDRMREHRLLFGYSACYHHFNTENVISDQFVDDMIERGCRYAWYFTYIPVGKQARTDLLATPEQRALMFKRVNEIRATKPLFAMDFWNDGEYAKGCIAGGRRYFHITAAGDIEPCAFIHYSNVNIHNVTLLEALQSPIFKAYRKRQPFNDNPLRPCPLLDNPESLVDIVKESGATSTDMEAPEEVEDLTAKTREAARRWAPMAEKLMAEVYAARAAAGQPLRPWDQPQSFEQSPPPE
ncbi:MAG TPA: radical SAM protein [Candidatus Saccharicenans sp.]|nr:radical SAM protein [Candidatus Saccharicenans sp.]